MLKILLIILCVLLALLIAFTLWLPSFVMLGKRQSLQEAFDWQSEHYDTSFYAGLEKEDYVVSGFEGYALHAELLKNPEPTELYVIISHGYTDNRMGALKYVPMYLQLGYNCIIYDLRGHGENERTITTYGLREAEDLRLLAEDARERFPEMAQLGLHGESLGAATTISSLKYDMPIDFAVADCGFSDIENVLRGGYRSAHLPEQIFDLAELGSRIRYGVSLKEMRPIDSLDGCELPILFMHGEEDAFILPANSEAMAARTAGYSELHLIPGAGHAESVLVDPESYERCVRAFLETIGLTRAAEDED